MGGVSRRTFLSVSAGGLAVLAHPATLAQAACSSLPPFLPNQVTVDCATRQNFKVFRQNPEMLGLAGVVSMSTVRGQWGQYQAGSLMLFPWLKPRGLAAGGITWPSVLPINNTQSMAAPPIRFAIPPVEFFCRHVLGVQQTTYFIGFLVDIPYSADQAQRAWFSNVAKLADGKGVGIDWTSSNLNHGWFGGSRWIPNTDTCNGASWRKVIVEGLQQASVGVC